MSINYQINLTNYKTKINNLKLYLLQFLKKTMHFQKIYIAQKWTNIKIFVEFLL